MIRGVLVILLGAMLSSCAGVQKNRVIPTSVFSKPESGNSLIAIGMRLGEGNIRSFTSMLYVNENALPPKGVVHTGAVPEKGQPSACFTQYYLDVGNLCVSGPGDVSTNQFNKFDAASYVEQQKGTINYLFWEVPSEYLQGGRNAIGFVSSYRGPSTSESLDYLALGTIKDSTKAFPKGVWSWDELSIAPYEYAEHLIHIKAMRQSGANDDAVDELSWQFRGISFPLEMGSVYYLGDIEIMGDFSVKKEKVKGKLTVVYEYKYPNVVIHRGGLADFLAHVQPTGVLPEEVQDLSKGWSIIDGTEFSAYQRGEK